MMSSSSASLSQLHKRFTTDQVKAILEKYTNEEIQTKEAIAYLGVSRARFYEIVGTYRKDPKNFILAYGRSQATRNLDPSIENNILTELKAEKDKIIDNPDVPTKRYNYSYIQNLLHEKYGQDVSVPTIIKRAKEHGYWKGRPPKKVHDREVLTNYTGELIQHDSSHHLFAPDAGAKWYLITSIDDHSRALLYADFVERETSWMHISAVQSLILAYGIPLQYYADQHAIFRYVKDRDKESIWNRYSKFTDDVDPQWRQVLKECGVKPIYALSPQAKGKIERPYQWLQDHLVRTCVREGVKTIAEGRELLKQEVNAYNWKRIHSTIKEIPMRRFEAAKTEKKTLFRDFTVPAPFQSSKDVFCLRITRTVDAYRTVSVNNLKLKVSGVMPRHEVELRCIPDQDTGLTEVRCWHKNTFVGAQKVKTEEIGLG
jgi:transposase